MSNFWDDNIIQIIPSPHITAVFTDDIGRLEWIPSAGTALYRTEDGRTGLQLFIFDIDGVPSDPTNDVNFVGWYSGNNRPTDDQLEVAIERVRRKSA